MKEEVILGYESEGAFDYGTIESMTPLERKLAIKYLTEIKTDREKGSQNPVVTHHISKML
jgi:hypothetical protein